MWYRKYLFSVATYRSELTLEVWLSAREAEHARKLIMRTLKFSSHSKASINSVSIYDLFWLQTVFFLDQEEKVQLSVALACR